MAARQRAEAQRINAFLATGGRVLWSRGGPEREIEAVTAVGRDLYVAFADGGEAVCALWDSMVGGFALRWLPARKVVSEVV